MKVTNVEKKEKSTVELTIQVEAGEFEAAVQKAYLKNRNRISVPGFRKGKAPRKIIESMYGSGVFYEDAINDVYPGAYEAAVKEQGLEDMGHPVMDIVEVGKDGLTFTALVSVRPEVKLGQYKGLQAPKTFNEVTDADIENELEPYIKRATRLVSVERPISMGDTAVIDFEGFDNGKPFEGGKGTDYSLEIGSGSFVPGFEDQLIGLSVGDEKDLDITFPEDYVKDLAGKAVVFHVKVKEVKESQIPEVDDEFAKDVSEFETLADFKKDLGEKLKQRREAQAESAFESAVLEQLIDNLEAEIPDGMVETQLDKVMDEYAMRMQSQGMAMNDYLKMMGMTPEMMRASAKPSALRQVQLELALDAVAVAENMEITDEDCAKEITKLAEQYNITEDQVKAALSMDMLKHDLRLQKANDFVVAQAVVGEAPKKEEAAEEKAEKPKRTRKKAAEESAEGEEKPKRTRKKKTEENTEEPKAE